MPFPLEQVLNSLTDLVGVQAEKKGLELLFDIDPSLPGNFVGDPLRLGQVLINLTTNAVKFTEIGSIIVGVKRFNPTLPNDAAEMELLFYVKGYGHRSYPRTNGDTISSFSSGRLFHHSKSTAARGWGFPYAKAWSG